MKTKREISNVERQTNLKVNVVSYIVVIDPRGRPTVTHTCHSSVRSHFSKSCKTKQNVQVSRVIATDETLGLAVGIIDDTRLKKIVLQIDNYPVLYEQCKRNYLNYMATDI